MSLERRFHSVQENFIFCLFRKLSQQEKHFIVPTIKDERPDNNIEWVPYHISNNQTLFAGQLTNLERVLVIK